MTPQQLRQTAQFIRERYSPPDPTGTPGKYVSHEAMHALADALDHTATALYVDERPAAGAPAAVHEAIDRAWASIEQYSSGTLVRNDVEDADEDVLEQLRTLTDAQLAWLGRVQAIVRDLAADVRAERRGES